MFHTSMFLPRSVANLPVAEEWFCNFQRRLEVSSSLFWKCIFWVKTKHDVPPFSISSVFFNSNLFERQRGKRLVILLPFFAFFVLLEFSFCTIYGACSPVQILQSYTFLFSVMPCAIWKSKFLLELANRISTKIP